MTYEGLVLNFNLLDWLGLLSVAPPPNENPEVGFSFPDFAAGIDSEFSELIPKPEEGSDIKVVLTDFSPFSSSALPAAVEDDPKVKPEEVGLVLLVETV